MLVAAVCALVLVRSLAFAPRPPPSPRPLALAAERRAYLDQRSLWRVTLRLRKDGHRDVEASLRVRFVEDRGFEPPSGRLFVEDDLNGLVRVDEDGFSALKWGLSEDKNDRKDGLWIWGLFGRRPSACTRVLTLAQRSPSTRSCT